jgi:hypothetical protein
MIDEGDIPSIQCKMSLRGLKSMRKVDGLNLLFIDFMFQQSHHVVRVPFYGFFHLMILATKLTAVLHAVSWVNFHSFLNLRLCFSRLPSPGKCLLRSKSLIFLVDSLFAEAIGAGKSRAALSASFPVNLDSR